MMFKLSFLPERREVEGQEDIYEISEVETWRLLAWQH
jgi:hypothetical protein